MCKKNIFCLLILFLSLNLRAAEDASPSYGALGGLDLASAQVTGYPSAGTQSLSARTGATVGIFTDLPLSHLLYFEPSFMLAQRGGVVAGQGAFHLDYFQIPVLLKAHVQTKAANFFAGAGLSYGIAVNKVQVNTAGTATSMNLYINNNELSVPIALGAQITLNREWSLMMEGRYSFGLTNVYSSNLTSLVPSTYTSRDLTFLMGVVFHEAADYESTEDRAIEFLRTHQDISDRAQE